MQTAKYNGVPGCPRVEVLSIDYDKAAVRSDEAEPGHALLIVPVADLSSFEGERDAEPTLGLTDSLIRMVSAEAHKQNGWEVLGIDTTSGTDGVIRFHRKSAPSGCHYGTAHFSTDGRESVAFEWGHYDLTYRGSREDFSTRVAKGR